MKLGANEPKKMIALGALVLLGGYLAYTNIFSGPSVSPTRSSAPAAAEIAAEPAGGAVDSGGRSIPSRAPIRARSDEFHPVLHSKRPEDRIDPSRIDPTLRLDLLAKLQEVEPSSGGRNLFKMGQQPVKADQLKGPEPIVKPAPVQVSAAPPPPPGPPAPPPINLKYYGFSSPPGGPVKTAFFLDGEDILVAKEGDTLKRRYRVVSIGASSAVLEDTDSKRQQTIRLTEEVG
jgi:hypothetical protein